MHRSYLIWKNKHEKGPPTSLSNAFDTNWQKHSCNLFVITSTDTAELMVCILRDKPLTLATTLKVEHEFWWVHPHSQCSNVNHCTFVRFFTFKPNATKLTWGLPGCIRSSPASRCRKIAESGYNFPIQLCQHSPRVTECQKEVSVHYCGPHSNVEATRKPAGYVHKNLLHTPVSVIQTKSTFPALSGVSPLHIVGYFI